MPKNLNVRFEDDDLHERLVGAARRNDRSVNREILTRLTASLDAPVLPKDALIVTPSTLGELLEKAATRGLEVGRKGTEGDFTAAGIAVHVLMDEGMLPTRAARTATPDTEETP